jgi:hypothetical protein
MLLYGDPVFREGKNYDAGGHFNYCGASTLCQEYEVGSE